MAEEKVAEKPTIDGTEPDKKTGEQTREEKMAKMLEALEAMNIKDEQHLMGVVETAQKYGPQAQELGELRDAVNKLVQENESLRNMTSSREPVDLYGDGQNIDLSKLVYESQMKATRDFYQKEVIEPQRKMQTKYFNELTEIQGDDDYKLVEKVFTEHINSPQIQARIANGQTSVTKEYDRTVRTMYRNVLKQTTDALKGVVKPEDVRVPHVEGQDRQIAMPTSDDEQREFIKKVIEKRKAGDISADQAEEYLLKAQLGFDPKDPFFQMGGQ